MVAALQAVYTVKSTRELAQLAILQFCEALGECELQQKYFDTFAKLQPLPEPERKVLTKPQVAEIRKKNNTLVVAALNLLKQTSITSPQLSTIYECMTILTMYGQDKRLEPLRRSDWLWYPRLVRTSSGTAVLLVACDATVLDQIAQLVF